MYLRKWSPARIQMDCRVLPRPISSHKIPWSLYLFKNDSQFTPSYKRDQDELQNQIPIQITSNLCSLMFLLITVISLISISGFSKKLKWWPFHGQNYDFHGQKHKKQTHLLVFPELCFDGHRNLIIFQFPSIKQLLEEVSFSGLLSN